MSSTFTTQRSALRYGEAFALDEGAAHNRVATRNAVLYSDAVQLPMQSDDHAAAYYQDLSFVEDIPTSRSTTASDSVRTRSGRATRRTDSPFSTSKSRISKSPASRMPASRNRKDKKSKFDRSSTPKLTAPLSVLTKDMSTPMKDMDAWVNRSLETRRQEVEKRNGYVTRPMNSFMLYRSAYADRTKAWCTQNNHQVVSSVSGESWPMESQEVRDQFNEWARLERNNHQAAHPDYKFSPSKLAKRRKADYCDDEAEVSSVGGEPDESYRPSGRHVRRRKCTSASEQSYLVDEAVGSDSHPYFNQQSTGFADFSAHCADARQSLESHDLNDIAYDGHGLAYNMHTGQYVQQNMQDLFSSQYGQGIAGGSESIPQSMCHDAVGGYGLPSGQQIAVEDLFHESYTPRPVLPVEQYYQQPAYSQQISAQQLYEHRQWLQAQCQPQAAIDPGLDAELAAFSVQGNLYGQDENHFGHALRDMPEYLEECSGPNGALAAAWNAMDELEQVKSL